MEPITANDEEVSDVEQFLNGFDFYEEQGTEFDNRTASSSFIRSGCYAALEEICLSELLSCLYMIFSDGAPLSPQSTGIDNDLSVWITHR